MAIRQYDVLFAVLIFETTGVMLTELGRGLIYNCICLRLQEKVRAMSPTLPIVG